MIKVGLSFINDELKHNMERLRLIKQNDSLTIEERNKRLENATRAEFMLDMMNGFNYTDGLIMREKHGVIIKQAEPYSFYRGENRLFETTKSSFYRKNSDCDEDKLGIRKLISEMRIALLRRVINELDLIKNWAYSDVFECFIAQHYGLDTEYLDITGNFLVAMFFAVTIFDSETGRHYLITDEYIKEHPEFKYGYFYKKKTANRYDFTFSDDIKVGDIIHIGFQPFMRCSAQFGYMIRCDKDYDLARDNNYEKYCFTQSSALSKYIYDKCKQGKSIMPYEGLNKILPVIKKIKETSTFDIKCFEDALLKCNLKQTNEEILESLNKQGININDALDIYSLITKEQVKLINDEYKEFNFKDYYGVEIWTRPVIPVKK